MPISALCLITGPSSSPGAGNTIKPGNPSFPQIHLNSWLPNLEFVLNHHRKGLSTAGSLNCIVVEDNNKQSALLRDYIAKTPKLNFAGKCESAADLIQLVIQSRADIVFWDLRLLDSRILLRLKEGDYHPLVVCIAGKADMEKNQPEADVFNYLS